jgi:hypothetical protein
MAESFSIAFEQVQLLSGLAPDQPVWLFLRATLHDENDLNTALEVQQVGALPPDANRAISTDYPVGDAGIYAPGLPVGDIVRSDHALGTGQLVPRFELNAIEVAEGQVLAVEVIMLPKVWFKTVMADPDDLDRWSRTAFVFLLGASNFGLAGAVAGAIIGAIWGDDDQEVPVPCPQTVVTARHIFTLDDLRALRSEGMRKFGPADNDQSFCGFIDSLYWLSANQHQPWLFGPSKPIEQTDCELRPWRHRPLEEWLEGTWLDRDSWESSCIGVSLNVIEESIADVWVFDQPSLGSQAREFRGRPITSDFPPNDFTINWYGDACPPRTVSPICPNCKRFTNVPTALGMAGQMLVALAMGSRHAGAEAWADSLVTPSSSQPASCAERARQRQLSRDLGNEEAQLLGRGVLFKRCARDGFVLWPNGTPPPPPPPPDPPRPPAIEDLRGLSELPTVADALFGCFKVELSEQEALFTYAEVPRRGMPMCPRLRYVRWDDQGNIVRDAMLQIWIRPPR